MICWTSSYDQPKYPYKKIGNLQRIVKLILTYGGAKCWQYTAKERKMFEAVEIEKASCTSRFKHVKNKEIRPRTKRAYNIADTNMVQTRKADRRWQMTKNSVILLLSKQEIKKKTRNYVVEQSNLIDKC